MRAVISSRAGTEVPRGQLVCALEGVERALESIRLVGAQREQRLPRRHRVPRLRVQVDARGVHHRILLAGSAGTEPPGGDPERQRLLLHQDAVGCCRDDVRLLGDRQRRIRIPALRPDHRTPGVHRTPVRPRAPSTSASRKSRQLQHLPRQRDRQFDHIGRASASRARRPIRAPRWHCRSRARAARSCWSAARASPPRRHCRVAPSSRRARATAPGSCMNAPEPNFTSSTSAAVPSAIFLLMIDDAISGIASTVPGDVTQRVELAVGGREVRPAAQTTAPTRAN